MLKVAAVRANAMLTNPLISRAGRLWRLWREWGGGEYISARCETGDRVRIVRIDILHRLAGGTISFLDVATQGFEKKAQFCGVS
jgi:hypothetical protein